MEDLGSRVVLKNWKRGQGSNEWLEKSMNVKKKKQMPATKNGKQNEIRAVVDYQSENLAINDCMCFSK